MMREAEKDKTTGETRMMPQTADPEGLSSRLLLSNLFVHPSGINKLLQLRTIHGC